jgi:F0F1-type ATP synthase membrane subunit c/vacuolar-type H+-ATPase subunit K
MSAWYWYLTGVITSVCGLSAIVNALIISGTMKIAIRNPRKTRLYVAYDWSDDSGELSKVS